MKLMIVIALALAFGAGTARAAGEPFGRLTVDEVAAKVRKPNTFIYDNNDEASYAKGHVPGATWLDYDSVKASSLPSDKSATLIFYCANDH